MNPISSIAVPNQLEALQRIDGARAQDPAPRTERSRELQAERALQPRSGVQVTISETARARLEAELDSTQTVNGSNATAATGTDPRDGEPPRLGTRLDVRA